MAKGFSPEYRNYIRSDRWRSKHPWLKSFFLGRDVVIPLLPGHHLDHITYRNLTQELPLRDVVLLHRNTHAVIGFIRTVMRKLLGRKLGNAVVAWFLRGCFFFWWGLLAWVVAQAL